MVDVIRVEAQVSDALTIGTQLDTVFLLVPVIKIGPVHGVCTYVNA